MTLIFRKGRDLIGFEVTLANEPGALSELTSFISRCSLNIHYIEILSLSEETGLMFIVLDFTDSEVAPSDIIENMKKIRCVKEVVMSSIYKDIVYPSKYTPLYLGPSRAVIFVESCLHGMIEEIKTNLGEEYGKGFLYQLGIGLGQRLLERYIDIIEKDIEEGIKLLTTIIEGARWGDIISHDIKDEKIIIRIKDLWECEIQKENVTEPSSNLMRGILGGFIRKLLRCDVVVKETKCISIGDSYCQFEINVIK